MRLNKLIAGNIGLAGAIDWESVNDFPVIVAQSAVAVANTGSTTKNTLATVVLPPGIMGANGALRIRSLWSATPNNVNVKTVTIQFGATTVYTGILTSLLQIMDERTVWNRGLTNSQVVVTAASNAPFAAGTVAVTTAAIDTTAAVSVLFTAQLATGTDTITLEAYTVELIRSV